MALYQKYSWQQKIAKQISKLCADFIVKDEELEDIRLALEHEPKIERTFHTELVDADGTVHATIERLIHISRKQ